MVNSQVTQEIINALKLDIMVEKLPTAIPVVEVGLKSVKPLESVYLVNTNSTGATIITAPLDRDMYIVGASLSLIRDGTATATFHELRYSDYNGTLRRLLSLSALTLTANSKDQVIYLNHPIRIQRGSNITVNSSTATGNFVLNSIIFYYLDEVS